MDIVPLGKSVKDALKEGEVITKLVERITSIPNHATTLKFDIGLTLYIANIVENEFIDKPADQKKLIILKIIHQIIPLQEGDSKVIENHLAFLLAEKKIAQLSTYQYITKSASNWFSKKFA